MILIDNGCNDQYEGATATLCIRASTCPETYDNAQARCNLEGGQLLQDTNLEIHVRNTDVVKMDKLTSLRIMIRDLLKRLQCKSLTFN